MPDGTDSSIRSRSVDAGGSARPLIVCVHGGGCNAGYFDLPGFSFCERAAARGYPLLLVNRPGHGGSGHAGGDFGSSAAAILAHIEDVISVRQSSPDYFMLGHSIGAAIVTIIAGEMRPPALRGVALSGIGDTPTPSALAWAQDIRTAQPGVALAADLLFGPHGSYSWRAPKALRRAAEDWRPAEVEESLRRWPARFAESARWISVPVHLRLAERERIWETGPRTVERIADFFETAQSVDADLLPDGGHLYEVHHRGRELMDSQLDFFDRLATRLDSERVAGVPGPP